MSIRKHRNIKIVILLFLFLAVILSLIILLFIQSNGNIDNELTYSIAEINSQTNDYDNPENNKSLKEWREINGDVIGIIKINGKEFPVVQGIDNDEYLHTSIYMKEDLFGVPFIDYQIDINDYDNLIIYGHSTYNKDLVFTFIEDYITNKDDIPDLEFVFEDDDGQHSYKILAAREVSSDENADRSWHNFNFEDNSEKYEYIKNFLKESDVVYDNEVSGKLMLLVTCNMDKQENRYMLLACENNS